MATVLETAKAVQAARDVALVKVAEALVADKSRIDDAQNAYEGGLSAELGKWPSWVKFAETIGVKASDLNHSKSEEGAFKSALDTIMDMVLKGPHNAWTSGSLAATREQEKQHRKAGRIGDALACKREGQSAASRRTELANVIRYGASVGRYVLDRLTQERELAGCHKATVWASVFSSCNRKCADIREAGGTITEGDLFSAAVAVLDAQAKPERTDEQKADAVAAQLPKLIDKASDMKLLGVVAANLHRLVGKASELGLLDVKETRAVLAVLNRNPRTQAEATEAEAAAKPVTRKSEQPKPAAPVTAAPKAPKAPPKAPKADKSAPVTVKSSSDAAKIAADVI